MVASPEKELRFTRSAQGQRFFLLSSLLIALAGCLGLAKWSLLASPIPFWVAFPLLGLGIGFGALAYYCLRHAVIILSPVGVEFFPLIRPTRNFRVWAWTEIDHIEFDKLDLTLHFNKDETAGAVLSLTPLNPTRRNLLKIAMEGRMKDKEEQLAAQEIDPEESENQ